jgi:hypothetical protein
MLNFEMEVRMSEHYSALAQVTIDRHELVAYLEGVPQQTAHWDDWGMLGSRTMGGLARVDHRLAMGAYRYQIRRIFQGCASIGRFCQYAEATKTFTFGTFFFSEDVDDLAFFFAIARGLSRYMRGSESGFAVAEKILWGDGPRAVMELSAGRSYFLDADIDTAYPARLQQATAAFEGFKTAYAVENPTPIDQLDVVR